MNEKRRRGFWGTLRRDTAHNLKTLAFPDCARKCAFIEIMGVGECESACPWKFDHAGNPVDGEKLRQNARLDRQEEAR
jgi:epoxyqueuosine reductase QueG